VVPPLHLLKLAQVLLQRQDKLNCERENGNELVTGISNKKKEE